MDQEGKIRKLKSDIEKSRMMRDKGIQMRSLLRDRNGIAQCEAEISQCQKFIDYFTEELHRLETRSSKHSRSEESHESLQHTTREITQTPVQGIRLPRSSSMPVKEEAEKKKYTNLALLDLLMTDTPYNKPKVSIKLHELEYKLDVENKVLAGIKTMAEVLDREPSLSDKRRRAEVQGQLTESTEKLILLKRALRKYKQLYIDEGDDDDYELETAPSARVPPDLRRPVTGKLQLQLIGARELAHAPTNMIKMPDTVVHIKIDGNIVYRTRPSRSDRWLEEYEIHVNKASEVEIAMYDQAGERILPIGIFWLKITDIVEGLRKKKVQQENGPGWVKADVLHQQQHNSHDSGQSSPQLQATPVQEVQSGQEGIEAWFNVEPQGEMALRLNFACKQSFVNVNQVRETANRRPLDKLGRAGAVRQRKEEVHEMNGHQFVEKKFYNIMKCALCGDFLVNSGFQCEDCEYTCHKKCYGRVVIKCISRSVSETDYDEDKLNHRIPHRFEPLTNIGASWCCHCGYMLPFGSRVAKKCSVRVECDITCHNKCAHLVPDFCGLSMEMANQMLAEIKAAKRKTTDGAITPSTSTITARPHRIQTEEAPVPEQIEDDYAVKPDYLSTKLSNISIDSTPTSPQKMPMPMPEPESPVNTSSPSSPILSGAISPSHMNMITSPGQASPMPYGQGYPNYSNQRPPQHPQQNQGPYAPIVNPTARPQQPYPTEMIPRPQPKPAARKAGLDDFNFLAVLGKGNFGKVMLAEEKHDKNLYAIKVLKKRFIIDNDEIESVRSEKRIFQAANRERHPFLIGLHSCFQTESRVYFVMEYVSGGDLMWHIQREPFSERRAKFYACEVLLALGYFHSQGIVYRDLKLDNIMLGLDGHIKVADYGLCKENMGYEQTTGTFCGTPEFMAPEILLEQKYGRAVDWWAFGVFIYEMLLGQSPFRGEDEDEIFDAILEDDILYPINMSRDSVSICQRLLTRDPNNRLGAGPNDAADIKAHPFFRAVNWDDMLNKRVPPPFYPTITGRLDTSNFDEEFTRERPALTPINSNMTRVEQQEFTTFSYIAEWIET
ncbi:kinase-like domain-containing protein [Phycomyces nitens]|nr:kinase-like domain-containing protein [Phycomyces nitens]